jgi:hypothetical protein
MSPDCRDSGRIIALMRPRLARPWARKPEFGGAFCAL